MKKNVLDEKIDNIGVVTSLLYQAPDVGEKAVRLLTDILNVKVNELKQYLSAHS